MKKPKLFRSGGEDDYLNKWQRVFWIDTKMRNGSYPSTAALAKECGVSSKTIQRDLEALRLEYELPIAYVAARRGWHYSEPTIGIQFPLLRDRDLFSMMVAENAISQYEGTPLVGYLRKGFKKLLDLLPGELRRKHEIAARAIYFGGQPAPNIDPEVWSTLVGAIHDRISVILSYWHQQKKKEVRRDLDPYLLLVRDRDWFLVGRIVTTDSMPLFYLPRIRKVELTGKPFKVKRGFSAREFLRYGFNAMQTHGGKVYDVALRFSPAAAHIVEERAWAKDQKVKRLRDGSTELRFRTTALFELERAVLSYGGWVEVLRPPELKAAVLERAIKMAALHR